MNITLMSLLIFIVAALYSSAGFGGGSEGEGGRLRVVHAGAVSREWRERQRLSSLL